MRRRMDRGDMDTGRMEDQTNSARMDLVQPRRRNRVLEMDMEFVILRLQRRLR